MRHHQPLLFCIVFALAAWRLLTDAGIVAAQQAAQPSAQPPNIIFLMTDQQRWDAIGRLNQNVKTPNLDRLAREGIIFRQAVCHAPMCVPSRYAMMLGLYPSQIGVLTNSDSIPDEAMPSPAFPEIFRRGGYQTAGFGKTHWRRTLKTNRGFEFRVVSEARNSLLQEGKARMMTDYNPQGFRDYCAEVADYGPGEEGVKGYIGCTTQVAPENHRDGWLAEQCLKFLDGGVDPKRPLLLYLSFTKPHAGMNVPKEFEDLYDINAIPDTPQPPWSEEGDTHLAAYEADKSAGTRHLAWRDAWQKLTPLERRRTVLRYYANCSWLDAYFGQVLDKLRKMGRLDNSLIVFTSDHGEMLGERNYHFSKYCLYDSSVRVPIILSGSVVPAEKRGTIDDRPAEHVDLVPTLLAAGKQPANPTLPGVNLLGEKRHAGTFSEFHGGVTTKPPLGPSYMWRTSDWKLILFLPGRADDPASLALQAKGELYNLKDDPHEWKNLYGDEKYAAVRERMKTELLMHLARSWSLGSPRGHALDTAAQETRRVAKKLAGGKPTVRLFVLAGQSNMVRLDEEKYFTPRIRKAFPKDELIVVKDAVGGTPIRFWYKDWKAPEGAAEAIAKDKDRQGVLYEELLAKVRKACEGKTPDTVSFCWMQGERDAKEGLSASYEDALRGLIAKVRKDLKHDDATVVIGRLSDHLKGVKDWDAVRAIQERVTADDPQADWVDTDAMNGPKNDLHYTAEGYGDLGRIFAEMTIGLLAE